MKKTITIILVLFLLVSTLCFAATFNYDIEHGIEWGLINWTNYNYSLIGDSCCTACGNYSAGGVDTYYRNSTADFSDSFVNITGDTMTGNLNMSLNNLTSVKQMEFTPTEYISSDAANELSLHFNDSDVGAKFYSGANELLNIRRFSSASPTILMYDAGTTGHIFRSNGVRMMDIGLSGYNYLRAGLNVPSPSYIKFFDSIYAYFGTGNDALVYYDTANLIIDPDNVGSGKVLIGATGDDDIELNNILANDGAAATPSYSFKTDVDSGMWYSGGLNFVTGGVRRSRITGTDVDVDNADLRLIRNDKKIKLGAAENVALYYDGTDFTIDTRVSGTANFLIPNGDVGIGTSTPLCALDVRGNTNISENLTAKLGTFTGDMNKSKLLGYGNARIGSYSGSTGWGTLLLETNFGTQSIWAIDNGGAGIRIYETTPGADQYARFRINKTAVTLGERAYGREIDYHITGDTYGIGDAKWEGNTNISGNLTYKTIYAQLSDSTDQTFAFANTEQPINFSVNDEIYGIGHSTALNLSVINITLTGIYTIIAQPQVATGAGGAGKFHMWLEKHDTIDWGDVPNSNVELVLANNEENVIPLIATIRLKENERIRVMASVSDTAIILDTQSPAGEPVIPSIIFTMYRLGD